MDPHSIAKLISLVADDAMASRISMATHSALNAALWDLARASGTAAEVDRILQAESEAGMLEAMSETLNPILEGE